MDNNDTERNILEKMKVLSWMEPTYEGLEKGERRGIEIKPEQQENLNTKQYIRNTDGEIFDLAVFRLWDKSKESQTIDENYTVENYTVSDQYPFHQRPSFETHLYRLNYNPTTEDIINFKIKNQMKDEPNTYQQIRSEFLVYKCLYTNLPEFTIQKYKEIGKNEDKKNE